MFYLFKNGTCESLCDDKGRLENLITEDDNDAVILEHERWLNPSDLKVVNGKIQIREIVQTDEEIKAAKLVAIRAKRDSLLVDSDWTDTLSAKTRLGDAKYNEWQVYRQALRDITKCVDLDNPVWPIKPV